MTPDEEVRHQAQLRHDTPACRQTCLHAGFWIKLVAIASLGQGALAAASSCATREVLASGTVIGGDVNVNYPDACESVFKPGTAAHRYAFDGIAGQLIRIRAVSRNLRSTSSPSLYLLGPGSDTPLAQAEAGPPVCDLPGCLTSTTTAILPSPGIAFRLPETGRYIVEVAVTGFGNYTLSFLQAASTPCDVSVAPRSISTGTAGGSYSLEVLTSPDCPVTPTSGAPWIHVQPATAISGYGQFSVQVDSNPGVNRSSIIAVGNKAVPVDQQASPNPGCSYVLSPLAVDLNVRGGTGSVTLTVGGPGPGPCTWQATSTEPWLTITPASGAGSATLLYTVKPNYSTVTRVYPLQIGGAYVTFTQQGSQEPPDWRFVRLLYHGALGRWPSDPEVAAHALNAARFGRASVAASIMNSAEYNLGSRFIAGLYVGLLNRDAEYAGWVFHRARLAQHLTTQELLVEAFLNSAEYALSHPNQSNTDFVRMLYRQVLMREPAQAEVDFHAGTLAAGLGRVLVARNFLNSAEFRTMAGPRINANLLYLSLLNRDCSAIERDLQMSAISGGMPLTSIIGAFVASAEFQAQLQ
jgi:hypothetical protein